MDFLDEPSQVVKNVLRGNVGAAGRHLANIGGDLVDAALPGDWIPDFRQEGDDVSSSELVGLDQKEHPILGGLTNFVGDTLLNPVTYIPGAAIAKGVGKVAGVAAEGISKIPGGVKALEKGGEIAEKVGTKLRAWTGNQRLTPETQALLQRARASGSNEAKAGLEASRTALGGLSDQELNIVGDVIDNHRWQDGKLIGRLADDGVSSVDRVALHPEVTPENADRIRQAVADTLEIGKNQAKVPGIFKSITGGDGKTIDLSDHDYLQRRFSLENPDLPETKPALPSAVKETSLKTPEERAQYLAETPGASYERSALKRAAGRAEEQGRLASRAEIGKAILGPDFAYADSEMRTQVTKNLKEMAKASPEDAQVLMDAFKGLPARGGAFKALAGMNGMFKKYAVYGAFIPKFGAAVRNKLSGIWQAAAEPATRGIVGGQAKRLGSDLLGALDDGIVKGFGLEKRLGGGQLSKSIDQIEAAFKASGGSAQKAIAMLPPELGAAVQHGVMDGFTSSEGLLKEMGRTGWKKKFDNAMNWPGAVFKGVEDRMRLGGFLDMLAKGEAPEKAAQAIRDAFYDYGVSSLANRNTRDIIPFFQFQAKAIPQSLKLMKEKPFVATAMASALGPGQGGEDEVYPYMEGKLNVPIGKDEQGNQQFVSGFGLPFESLTNIPNLSDDLGQAGRQFEQGVVAASNPLIKTPFAAISGEDPYFGTPYGSYDKVPMFGNAGKAGSVYNQIASTGIAEPLTEPMRVLGQLTDERHSPGAKALDLLTGANVVSVDQDRVLQQQLQAELENNPQVSQYRSFFDQNDDPETQALIRAYQAAKKRSKAKRAASK